MKKRHGTTIWCSDETRKKIKRIEEMGNWTATQAVDHIADLYLANFADLERGFWNKVLVRETGSREKDGDGV